jgi:hypothetical protein
MAETIDNKDEIDNQDEIVVDSIVESLAQKKRTYYDLCENLKQIAQEIEHLNKRLKIVCKHYKYRKVRDFDGHTSKQYFECDICNEISSIKFNDGVEIID